VKRLAGALLLLVCLWAIPLAADPPFRACGFHWLTGLNCPFCGLTRALLALAKGRWVAAIHFNALSPLGFVMLFGLFWRSPAVGRLWTAGLAAFAIYGVCRILVPTV
jgi:hypothetical protein